MYKFLFSIEDIEQNVLEHEPHEVTAMSLAEAWVVMAAYLVRIDNPEASTVRCIGAEEIR